MSAGPVLRSSHSRTSSSNEDSNANRPLDKGLNPVDTIILPLGHAESSVSTDQWAPSGASDTYSSSYECTECQRLFEAYVPAATPYDVSMLNNPEFGPAHHKTTLRFTCYVV